MKVSARRDLSRLARVLSCKVSRVLTVCQCVTVAFKCKSAELLFCLCQVMLIVTESSKMEERGSQAAICDNKNSRLGRM